MDTANKKFQEMVEDDQVLKTVVGWLVVAGMEPRDAIRFALGYETKEDSNDQIHSRIATRYDDNVRSLLESEARLRTISKGI